MGSKVKAQLGRGGDKSVCRCRDLKGGNEALCLKGVCRRRQIEICIVICDIHTRDSSTVVFIQVLIGPIFTEGGCREASQVKSDPARYPTDTPPLKQGGNLTNQPPPMLNIVRR